MSEYDNDNKAAVWVNDRKESDRHPDYRGSAMVNGVEYWLSAWASDGTNPKAPVLKFSFSQKEAVAQAGIASTRSQTGLSVQPVAGAARPAAAMPDAAMPDAGQRPAEFEDIIPF